MVALHAVWSRDSQLCVWGEDSTLPARAGARNGRPPATPRPRPHPFACGAQRLCEALERLGVTVPALAEGGRMLVLTLPSSKLGPQASPQLLRADQDEAAARRAERLDAWEVPAHGLLLPAAYDELSASCTCPDSANPCKHLAAVYYILAEHFDEDPFAIFTWRGRTKEELLENLRARRTTANTSGAPPGMPADLPGLDAAPPLSALLDRFWRSGPELGDLHVSPLAGEAPDGLLRQLGPAPIDSHGQNLVELLTPAYARLAAEAERRAFEE